MNDTLVNIFIEMNDTTVKIKKKEILFYFYSIFFLFDS